MPFGGSVTALTQLIVKVTKALSDSQGAQAEYQGLVQTLVSLLKTINTAEEMTLQLKLQRPSRCAATSKQALELSMTGALHGIAREREICHKLIEDFMFKSREYTHSLIHGGGKAKALKMITWTLFHKGDVERLERKLKTHMEAIQFFMFTLGL